MTALECMPRAWPFARLHEAGRTPLPPHPQARVPAALGAMSLTAVQLAPLWPQDTPDAVIR